MVPEFNNDYIEGTRYIFDLFTSRMAGKFSFSSDPQVDYENFPRLEQPILVWVPDTNPYAVKLNPRLIFPSNYFFAAVKVTVNEVPKPLKPYTNNQEYPVIFWNWPDSTPTSFSAFIVRCSPLILPQITRRNYDMMGRGYLLDEALYPVVASDKSNYLGLVGPHFVDFHNFPIAYVAPVEGPVSVHAVYVQYGEERPIAAQYLTERLLPPQAEITGFGEAAPYIGYWMAFLPVSCNPGMFEQFVVSGGLCHEEDEDEEGEA